MKKKKFVTWIILLMSVSLITIILMQTFHLLNAYKKSRDSIERGVSQAITSTLVSLQKQDAVFFVHDKLTESANTAVDSTYPIDPYMLQSGFYNNYMNTNNNIFEIHIQSFPSVAISQFGQSFFETFPESKEDFFDIEKFLFEDFENKKMQIQNIINQLEVEFLHRTIPIEKRFDAQTIENILKQSLLTQGLNLDFEFAIIDEHNKMKIYSEDFNTDKIDDCHRFNLIPGSIFSNPDVFLVYFPSKEKYALETIYAQLGTSFLLTLLFIFTFGVSLYALIRQKKISEVKTDFINNMTHEFKTPLATIKLAAASLTGAKNNPISDAQKHMIDIIFQETNRMNQHVEQVLQMAVLERQNIKLRKSLENINDLIMESINSIELVIKEREGNICVDLSTKNVVLDIDRDLIMNVLNNILDNAVKYSNEKPEIIITSYIKKKQVYILIKDNGIGMSKEVQEKVFERFYRAPTGNVHNVKGFGLGLNYAKEIITAHKGDIKVKSSVDKGSTFIIELPITK